MSRERIINQTKQLLKDNLIDLLEEKNIEKITIKELCKKADINRTTYYKYYLDQYDQLEKIEDEIFIDMGNYIDNNSIHDSRENEIIIKNILEYIENNQRTFKILLEKADINFQNKMLSFIGKKIFNKEEYSTIDEEIVYIYTAVGSFGVVSEWIKGNLKIDKEELIKQILKLNNTKR